MSTDNTKGLNPVEEKDITLEMRLENLKTQSKNLEATYTKIQGAIEFCEALISKEEEKPNKKEKGK